MGPWEHGENSHIGSRLTGPSDSKVHPRDIASVMGKLPIRLWREAGSPGIESPLSLESAIAHRCLRSKCPLLPPFPEPESMTSVGHYQAPHVSPALRRGTRCRSGGDALPESLSFSFLPLSSVRGGAKSRITSAFDRRSGSPPRAGDRTSLERLGFSPRRSPAPVVVDHASLIHSTLA